MSDNIRRGYLREAVQDIATKARYSVDKELEERGFSVVRVHVCITFVLTDGDPITCDSETPRR